MKVCDVMTRNVECTSLTASLQEVAERMRLLNVGALPVCAEGKLVGMITDRDITVRAIADGADPWTNRVSEIMTPEVVYCFDDEDVTAVAALMGERQIRRLPILNRDKKLVGIVSLGDLAVETADDALVGHALEGISESSEAPVASLS